MENMPAFYYPSIVLYSIVCLLHFVNTHPFLPLAPPFLHCVGVRVVTRRFPLHFCFKNLVYIPSQLIPLRSRGMLYSNRLSRRTPFGWELCWLLLRGHTGAFDCIFWRFHFKAQKNSSSIRPNRSVHFPSSEFRKHRERNTICLAGFFFSQLQC